MADDSDFAHTPPSQKQAYGPGGGWGPESDATQPGIQFLRDPQKARAEAAGRVRDAESNADTVARDRVLVGSSTVFGKTKADVSDAASRVGDTQRELNKVDDFIRRKSGR